MIGMNTDELDKLRQALQELSAFLGATLELEEDGTCYIEWENRVPLAIELAEEGEVVVAMSIAYQGEWNESFAQFICGYGWMGKRTLGAVLAADWESRQIVLAYRLTAGSVTGPLLRAALDRVLRVGLHLQEVLENSEKTPDGSEMASFPSFLSQA